MAVLLTARATMLVGLWATVSSATGLEQAGWLDGRESMPIRELENDRFCNIDRVPADMMTAERFLAEYEGKRPVVLTDATAEWPSVRWNLSAFESNSTLAAVSIPARGYLKGGEEEYLPSELAAAAATQSAMLPLRALAEVVWVPQLPLDVRKRKMVIDAEGLALSPVLQDGYRLHPAFAHGKSTNLLRQIRLAGNRWVRDLQKLVRGQENPDPLLWKDRFLISGPSGGGTAPHIDIEHQSFWNGLVRGQKRWVFISKAHLAAMENYDSKSVASWSTATMTALDWYRDWYPKIADGWGQQTSDGTKTHELYECYQEEGDVVYGPGGWMHVVVSIKDSLVLSEQMMFPSDLPGAVPVAALDQLHLLEAGLCDINVVELQLTSYAQLRVVRLLMQQRTEPSDLAQLPSISRGDRVKIVVNILRFCAGLYEINKPLWKANQECDQFFKACGGFAKTAMGGLKGKPWYPAVKNGSSSEGKKVGDKGSGRKRSKKRKTNEL